MKKVQWAAIVAIGMMFLAAGCSTGVQTLPVVTVSGAEQSAIDASNLPEAKQTTLGLYITSLEAFEKWRLNPDGIKILDCRTPEEYVFVGHAPMAHNIPKQFMTYTYNAEKKSPVMKDNPDFLDQVIRAFKPTDTIFAMCRSGGRSAKTVNMLAEAGFTKVYNVVDGFEGDKVKDPGSCYDGKRMRNGWKNSGAPWTYGLDPKLMYLAE